MKDRRFGVIAISEILINEHAEDLITIFNKIGFLPMAIEKQWQRSIYIYKGYSENFDVVKEGGIIPAYKIIVTMEHDDLLGKSIGACSVSKTAYFEYDKTFPVVLTEIYSFNGDLEWILQK